MPNESHDRDELSMPEPSGEFVDALSELVSEPVLVPEAIDDRVLGAADRRLSAVRRRRYWVRRVVPVAGAAAAIVAVVWIGQLLVQEPRAAIVAVEAAGERTDVDGSGRTDMLDALALAQRIEQAEVLPLLLDVNDDGRVDGGDVAEVAASAVRLPEFELRDGGAG